MLHREAMLTAKFEHPGIVKIHDIYQAQGHDCFVMQLVRGDPFGELLIARESPLEFEDTSRLVRHLLHACEAIAHAHAQRIVHGDVSPRNIMVAPDGTTYVIDWGLAHALDDARDAAADGSGAPAGTPGFVAPELFDGRPASLASDVFSLGALLYTILEGRPPDRSAPIFSERARARQPALAAISERCLHLDPLARYPDAGALGRELEAWFEGRRLSAYTPSLREAGSRYVREHKALFAVASCFAALLVASVVTGVAVTQEEAARAARAEAVAQREAARVTRTLIEARVDRAQQALGEGDTWAAAEAILQGLELGDGPELRGLLMQLGAVSLPERTSSTPLPECTGRWVLPPTDGDALCVGPGTNMASYRHGELMWTYDVVAHLERGTAFDDAKGWRELQEMWADEKKKMRTGVEQLIAFDYIDTRADRDRVYVLDNHKWLHVLDAQTGELLEYDARRGVFVSIEDPQRISIDRGVLYSDEMAWSPCPSNQGGVTATPSVGAPGSTLYMCGDGSLQRTSPGDEEAVTLAPAGANIRVLVEISETGEVIVADKSGMIRSLGRDHLPLFAPSTPMRMLEVPDTPYVLVRGMERSLRLFDRRTMRWSVSLPPDAQAVRVGAGGSVWLVRGGALERWQIPSTPRLHRYVGQHGFSQVAWSSRADALGAVDGGGFAHVTYPLSGERLSPVSVSTRVAKAIVADPESPAFFVRSIGKGPMLHVRGAPGDELLDVRERAGWNDFGRRVGALKGGALYLTTYGERIVFQPAVSGQLHTVDSRHAFLDLSVDPAFSSLLMVSPHELWRFDAQEPERLHALDVELSEDVVGVALRHDARFVLLERSRVTFHDPSGGLLGYTELTSRPVDAQWHPTEPLLFLGDTDGGLTVLEEREGRFSLRARVTAHKARVGSVTVQPSGRWVATASWDASLLLYDVESLHMTRARLLEVLRARLGFAAP